MKTIAQKELASLAKHLRCKLFATEVKLALETLKTKPQKYPTGAKVLVNNEWYTVIGRCAFYKQSFYKIYNETYKYRIVPESSIQVKQ